MTITNQKQLPEGEHHLLLPRAHVHFFAQVVTVVLGATSFITGLIVYILAFSGSGALDVSALALRSETAELLAFFASGLFMGLGASTIVGWALWRFVQKFRMRFIIAFAASTITILSGLASVAIQELTDAANFTFYFFMITFGVMTGLLSLFYFFQGLSRHLWGRHHT